MSLSHEGSQPNRSDRAEIERLTAKVKGLQFDLDLQTADAKRAREEQKYLSRQEATNVIRGIFRRCGYAVAEHGTKGQDLDLIAVPWTDRAGVPALIVEEVVEALDGTVLRGAEPGEKPHGRLVWTIVPGGRRPHDLWYLDLGVIEPKKMQICDVCEKTGTDTIVFRDGTTACVTCTIELLQAEIQEFRDAARAVLDAGLVRSHPTLDRLRAAVQLREETDEENA